ncbi:3-hydroxyisobutyrate dehydrogenase [Parafannyhessea umbonata]|uniref:3-hydroxyisobutyrate dehydrogenase n=1 Tax=Parafannyhessea umbonata TaxID=604330 RepID=UPI0026F0CA07|nr:3-hydroxyisobutyrate dehydrogenase [Parafannyhessea umbonata]MDD7200041.1 3-hydroxyisobutyrate dehydrogenase [Parafannyhessea umbonata]MDY4418088.1 3-hydroxyisobutyrate dehydrogenase [Parafannyhessea umbonata]
MGTLERTCKWTRRLAYTASKVDEILAAPSALEDTKSFARAWKSAVANGDDADKATDTFLDAISEHQTTIDDLIAFAGSEVGKQVFGEEGANAMVAHSKKRKEAGAMFCDCAACRPCHELLHKFGREKADVYL